MEIHTSYSVKIKGYNHIFDATVELYRNAESFFIDVVNREWERFSALRSQMAAVNLAEQLTIVTAKHPIVPYDFGKKYYKFPSYLRRAAIAEAYGKVCSYRSNLKNWENSDKRTRGARPSAPKAGNVYPAMYRGNTFIRTGEYTASVKIFIIIGKDTTSNLLDWLW